MLSLLPINKIQTLGLDLAINKGTDQTGHDLLRLGVVVNLAYHGKRENSVSDIGLLYCIQDRVGRVASTVASFVVLIGLHSFVSGRTTDELVGPFGFVGAVGDLVVATVLIGVV